MDTSLLLLDGDVGRHETASVDRAEGIGCLGVGPVLHGSRATESQVFTREKVSKRQRAWVVLWALRIIRFPCASWVGLWSSGSKIAESAAKSMLPSQSRPDTPILNPLKG